MTITLRVLLAILFLEAAVVGAWNAMAPESFYRDFPTVDLTPPFSEHYARDFGWAMLGIALLLGIALARPRTHYAVPAALAYLMFAVPHFFFHLTHMDHASMGQAALLTTANAAVAILGVLVVVLAVLRDRAGRRRAGAAPSGADRPPLAEPADS